MQSSVLDDSVLPFGMTWDNPAFERACALARSLLGVETASIIIVHDGKVMRSVDPEGKMAPVGGSTPVAIERGKTIWTDDARADPVGAKHPLVAGPPYIRFTVATPIKLGDGSVLGALAAFGPEPKAFDPVLRRRLEDIAAFVADECDRARTAVELAEGGRMLQATRSTLDDLFNVIPVSIFVVDREMRLMEGSRRFFDNVGVEAEEAFGKNLYELHPRFEVFRDVYGKVLAGEVHHADRGKWIDTDGNVRWLRSEIAPRFDENGDVIGMVSVSLDITEVVETLKLAEKAEQRMNLATELASLHVWEIDYQNEELIVAGGDHLHQQQIDLFGRELTFSDLAGGTDVTVHPDDRARLQPDWTNAVVAGEKYVAEYRVNRDDDEEVWAACSVSLTHDRNGNPRGLIGAMQNITDRKKAELALVQAKEDAEAANKAKSAFLATMSHEIRTPLNGVLGMAQAMEGDELTPSQREKLSIIRQSGETLLAILNDVLDLSKIEAGKLALEEAEFDISDVARGAHAAFTELANRKGIDFNLTISEEARGAYLGDSTRVRQILYNLVSNALKFTSEGEVDVDVNRADDALVLTVRDSGVGISEENVAKLFSKFEQGDASTTRKFGGTGLGLAICRDLARLMNGEISVSSTLGEGTAFEVTLPLRKLEGAAKKAEAAPVGAGGQIDVAELRILAAEDNQVNQLVLKTLLHQAGIEPVVVSDGQEALEAWRNEKWDVILMDVQMPNMDGPTATARIREEEKATGRVRTPIVALTANAMSHQVAEYLACGMDDFVAKPIEIGALFEALERVLNEAETAPDRKAL